MYESDCVYVVMFISIFPPVLALGSIGNPAVSTTRAPHRRSVPKRQRCVSDASSAEAKGKPWEKTRQNHGKTT